MIRPAGGRRHRLHHRAGRARASSSSAASRCERWVRQTNFDNDEAVGYLADRLDRLGVEAALAKAGASPGDPVRIGEREFDWQPTAGEYIAGPRGTDVRLEDPYARLTAAERLAARKARRQRPDDELLHLMPDGTVSTMAAGAAPAAAGDEDPNAVWDDDDADDDTRTLPRRTGDPGRRRMREVAVLPGCVHLRATRRDRLPIDWRHADREPPRDRPRACRAGDRPAAGAARGRRRARRAGHRRPRRRQLPRGGRRRPGRRLRRVAGRRTPVRPS